MQVSALRGAQSRVSKRSCRPGALSWTACPPGHRYEAIDALSTATDSATDDDLLSALTLCEGTSRRLDRVVVATVSTLERRGTFAERGYKSTPAALGDLLG
ncbi:hypothetical protein ACQPWY_08960 [Pseudonocardia xinjiangensis]|uniref:hypothetical protein n=1 Tax=Pseudonocardia xinjiangensis TaxID=75289 RepID=UPI003D8C38A7